MRIRAGFTLRFGCVWAVAAAWAAATPAAADTITYDLTTCQLSSGCTPGTSYGTVTVSMITSTEVSVTLALAGSEVFAIGGAGDPLLFEVTNDPAISVSNISDPNATGGVTFSFTSTPNNGTHANGTGYWDYYIGCSGCGTGAMKGVQGPLSFDVSLASGISPESFAANAMGFYFATDIGLSKGSQYTGDVAATVATPVPLPPSLPLIASALAALAWLQRRGHAALILERLR